VGLKNLTKTVFPAVFSSKLREVSITEDSFAVTSWRPAKERRRRHKDDFTGIATVM
jgi:hypothetical protein